MGIPKFYRWISERYPNTSRVIKDNQIPDFDNFYLDMNGIIHACSHVNEDSCETNVTEEEIFRNIFHYIDFLFRMIKPKKVFYMAVDGVAPRAKMNQQRSRRFRAGRDRMKKLNALAEKTGQTLKETIDHHFDTNAITPGTEFMANLDEQLKYFINVKLTTDPLWAGVDIHLSGHLTPGEGEHKIMEYIRYTRSQPVYDVNTRHCLYGLDADLIMLGLVTHEMHFALLREEVKYGTKKVLKILAPEEINWHLLQLCLLRDYIDLEFRSVREKLKFPYDLESIVDDWILMGYLVGNDFIPHLPHVHINQDALPLLWNTYKKVLPTLDGYMNESGELNLARFEIYIRELAKYDYERFENETGGSKHFDKYRPAKANRSELDKDQVATNTGFSLQIMEALKISAPITPVKESAPELDSNGQLIDTYIANERQSSNLSSSSSPSSEANRPAFPDADDDDGPSSGSEHLSDGDEEKKVPSTLNTPQITTNETAENKFFIEAQFRQHKNEYYREKMRTHVVSTEQLQIYVQQYIEALQWILKYYYQGCPSWSWFYPNHYAPYLSDLTNFKQFHFVFQRGTPFKPFEQLLGVLPPTSRYLLPTALQPLMIDVDSPLLHFYPEDFQLDQNEKKQDWESVVLLPFIDEQLLLNSIQKYYANLSAADRLRNQYAPSLCFQFTPQLQPISGKLGENPYFPPLKETQAKCTEFPMDFYRPEGLRFRHGRFDEKNMKYFPKFPILNVLPYKFDFKKGVVDLFESRSKSTTVVLSLTYQPDPDCIAYNEKWTPKDSENSQPFQITNRQGLVERYLGKRVFVNWPHFDYGVVCAISDFRCFYTWSNIPGGSHFSFRPLIVDDHQDQRQTNQAPIYVSRFPFEMTEDYTKPATIKTYTLDAGQVQMEYTKAININRRYENQQGVMIGSIPILLYVCPLIGYRSKCSNTSDKCQTTMCFSNQAFAYPLQTTLTSISNYRHDLYSFPQTIEDYFRKNEPVFALQMPYYSCLGYVQQIVKDAQGKAVVECRMEPSDVTNQPDLHQAANRLTRLQLNYWTAQQVAEYLQTMPSVISKITGAIIVTTGTGRRENVTRINVGLSWKANKPLKQLYGYTKKEDQVWLYSDTAALIISDYMLQFPEIVAELIKKPKDDSYPEVNVWPARKGKSRLQELRGWIKKLPTGSMSLMDGAWQMLDAPVIKEIDRLTKSFFNKNPSKSAEGKTKTVSIEANRLFKACESLGMCDPDMDTHYELYDRVVSVRLGTGVPIGTRGTIIGVMLGQTHLDTYYEVLFDHLPKNSLDAILLVGSNQQCRIKVRSYHLLNYSHSLRTRSMANYQQQQQPQRAGAQENAWERRTADQTPAGRQAPAQQQQPTRILKRGTTENASATKAKLDAVPSASTQEKPKLVDIILASAKEQSPKAKSAPLTSTEKVALPQALTESALLSQSQKAAVASQAPMEKAPEPKKASPAPQRHLPGAHEMTAPQPANPTFPSIESLLLRAIQDSKQIQNPEPPSFLSPAAAAQQSWNNNTGSSSSMLSQAMEASFNQEPWGKLSQQTMPSQSSSADPFLTNPHTWDATPPVQSQPGLFAQAIESMSRAPPSSMMPSGFEQQSPRNLAAFSPPVAQSTPPMTMLQRAIQQSEQQLTFNSPSNGFNGSASFPSMGLLPANPHPGFPTGPGLNPASLPFQQQSPVRMNNVRLESPQAHSSPSVSHTSPPSQSQPQQVTSPRPPGGSTLQFVPSQVLRKIPKKS